MREQGERAGDLLAGNPQHDAARAAQLHVIVLGHVTLPRGGSPAAPEAAVALLAFGVRPARAMRKGDLLDLVCTWRQRFCPTLRAKRSCLR